MKQEFKVMYNLEGIKYVLQQLEFSFKLSGYLYSDPAERAFFEHQLQHAVQHLDGSQNIMVLDEATLRMYLTRPATWCLRDIAYWTWERIITSGSQVITKAFSGNCYS
ncbi:MAG: hypothetical protein ACFFD4_12485 [Candidatus Odinarchaeota archaeon]